jgi:hypothetical protein
MLREAEKTFPNTTSHCMGWLTLLVVLFSSFCGLTSQHNNPNCCFDTEDGCKYHVSLMSDGMGGIEMYRKDDDTVWPIRMSRANEIPGSLPIDSSYYKDKVCTKCNKTYIAFKVNGTFFSYIRFVNRTGDFVIRRRMDDLSVRPDGYENVTRTCSKETALVLQKLFNCDKKTHNENYTLDFVGTFYTRNRMDSYIVGYYKLNNLTISSPEKEDDNGDEEEDEDIEDEDEDAGISNKTTITNRQLVQGNDSFANDTEIMHRLAIVWHGNGSLVSMAEFTDYSETNAITGWIQMGGKSKKSLNSSERVIAIQSFDHICFYDRSHDAMDFIPSIQMYDTFWNQHPQCLNMDVLFGCKQSFCKTGFIDEVVSVTSVSGEQVLMFRGSHGWKFNAIQYNVSTGFPISSGDDDDNRIQNIDFSGNTVTAIVSMRGTYIGGRYSPTFLMLDNQLCIQIYYGWDDWPFNKEPAQSFKCRVLVMPDNFDIIAGYFNETTLQAHAFSEDKKHIIYNATESMNDWNKLAKYKDRTYNNSLPFDAMFKLDGIVYQKAGQFLWQLGKYESSVRPILRHAAFNPNGLISVNFTECGGGVDDETFFKIVNQTRGVRYRLIGGSLFHVPDLEPQTKGEHIDTTFRDFAVMIWCTVFTLTWFVRILSQKYKLWSKIRDKIRMKIRKQTEPPISSSYIRV